MFCYKFPDRDTFLELAKKEGLLFTDEKGEATLQTCSHDFSIDEIGPIAKGGEWDPESGEMLVAPTVLEGHHVNTQGLNPDAWADYLVQVDNPVRVFFGG